MVVAAVAAVAAVVGAVVAVAVSSEIGELLQLGAPASPRRTHSSSAAWQLQGGDALGRKFAPFEGHGRIQPTKLSSRTRTIGIFTVCCRRLQYIRVMHGMED